MLLTDNPDYNRSDEFCLAKFIDGTWDVKPGWSYANFVEWYWSGVKKTTTRNAYTSTTKYLKRL